MPSVMRGSSLSDFAGAVGAQAWFAVAGLALLCYPAIVVGALAYALREARRPY